VEDADDRSLLEMLGQALGKSKDNFTFDTGPIETAKSAEPPTKRPDEVPAVEQVKRTTETPQTFRRHLLNFQGTKCWNCFLKASC
jgi:hypothetical protein